MRNFLNCITGNTMNKQYAISILLIVIGAGLCSANFVFPYTITIQEAIEVPYTVQVPYQTVENKEKIVHSVSGTISGGYFFALPPNGIYLNSGKTLKLSWSADGYLSAYILTETQFKDFKIDGIASNYEAKGYAREGIISTRIRHNDRYYAVVSNSPIFASPIKLYEAKAILIWQETVTKYENETRYRTEYITKEVNSNLYLYSGLVIIGIGAALKYKASRIPKLN